MTSHSPVSQSDGPSSTRYQIESQRVFSARGPDTARRTALGASAGIVLFCLPLALIAIAATEVVGDTEGPILYALLGDHAPAWLAVLVISGLVSASLTTVGGVLLAASAVAVRSHFRRFARMTRCRPVSTARSGRPTVSCG